MNSRELARYLILGGVLTGLTAGTNLLANEQKSNSLTSRSGLSAAAQPMGTDTAKAADKHACKGLNSCKGKGNCKSGDAGCAGKNSCKGKGGCASKDAKHDCAGKNACKGLGAGGKNECKGKGSCAVPPKA
jgi:hypothetical protein